MLPLNGVYLQHVHSYLSIYLFIYLFVNGKICLKETEE